MRNDSTTAVPSCSFGSTLMARAWSFTGPRRRKDADPDLATLDSVCLLAAPPGIAMLIVFLLAIVAVLIFFLPAAVHLVVK